MEYCRDVWAVSSKMVPVMVPKGSLSKFFPSLDIFEALLTGLVVTYIRTVTLSCVLEYY